MANCKILSVSAIADDEEVAAAADAEEEELEVASDPDVSSVQIATPALTNAPSDTSSLTILHAFFKKQKPTKCRQQRRIAHLAIMGCCDIFELRRGCIGRCRDVRKAGRLFVAF